MFKNALKTATSDVLLRPDIALLLPLLTATSPTFLLLSTVLLPFKWASGCSCFYALCKRKTTSRRHAYLIIAFLVIANLMSFDIPMWLPTLIALTTPESIDTKFLKLGMILCGKIMPLGAVLATAMMALYLHQAGYKLRLNDSWELLLSNDQWLLTKDIRLAKRVNQAGEFHAEILDDGKSRLVGDGRLVGEGKTLDQVSIDQLDKENMDVVRVAESKGRAVVDGSVIKIVRNHVTF